MYFYGQKDGFVACGCVGKLQLNLLNCAQMGFCSKNNICN